jgi:hypothetical protein
MNEKSAGKEIICKCPYCDGEIKMDPEAPNICQPCDVKLVECPKCGQPMREGLECCPSCESS